MTIFAPTDEAFNSLAPRKIRQFQRDGHLLRNLVLHHVVDNLIPAGDFYNEKQLRSLAITPNDQRVPLTLNLYDKKVHLPFYVIFN